MLKYNSIVGSIGEVFAAYYYGIELYTASTEVHDGQVDAKRVQIKMTQQDRVAISNEPEYLIVLYLRKNGDIFEVYNGPGKKPWETASKPDRHNNRHMTVNKLMDLDKEIGLTERITTQHDIFKMQKKYKNVKGKNK